MSPNASRVQRFDTAGVLALSHPKGNPHLPRERTPVVQMRRRPGAIGEAMTHGPGLISARSGWLGTLSRIPSAALGDRRDVLGRDLRERMLAERAGALV